MTDPKFNQLGEQYRGETISEATLKEDDVFDALREFLPDSIIEDFDAAWAAENFEMTGYILWEQAFDHMNAIAPEGCYFGSHEGDGACFGFWEGDEPSNESDWDPFGNADHAAIALADSPDDSAMGYTPGEDAYVHPNIQRRAWYGVG